MNLKIVEADTGSSNQIRFDALCDGVLCGRIRAHKTKVSGRVVYTVSDVNVEERNQRRGVATKLYEAAHAGACSRRSRLASTARNAGAFSNDFWRKQEARGRVEVYPHKDPRLVKYVVSSCDTRDLSGLKKRR